MDKQISSYWGNIDYVGLSGPAGVVVRIESHELLLDAEDPALKGQALHVTRNNGTTKLKPFVVVQQSGSGRTQRILAVYYAPPSRELIQDIRESIGESNFVQVLAYYDPDYMVKN
jgi:hypothetical protein